MDVSVSTVKAWRRLGLLQPHRDYTWLPSTRSEPKAPHTDKNIRYLWPQARDSILSQVVPRDAAKPDPQRGASSRRRQDGKPEGPAMDLSYRAPS
jgi:hypothetical protein